EFACQGANRIGALAAFRLGIPVAGLALVGALRATGVPLTPFPAIAAYLGGILLASGITLAALRPSLAVGRAELARVGAAVREFGLDLYAGRVVGMMSLRLDQVLIPFFVGTRRWGAYKIA